MDTPWGDVNWYVGCGLGNLDIRGPVAAGLEQNKAPSDRGLGKFGAWKNVTRENTWNIWWMLNDRFLPQFGFRSVCSGSLDSDVILFGCVQIEVRKHTAVCLSHCGPPSCTLKLAESRHKRHESQSARRRTIRAIVDGFPAVCFHSDYFWLHLHPRNRIAIAWNAQCFVWQEDPTWTNASTITLVICARASRAQYKSWPTAGNSDFCRLLCFWMCLYNGKTYGRNWQNTEALVTSTAIVRHVWGALQFCWASSACWDFKCEGFTYFNVSEHLH